jgi:heat-inducible transcriptional repressor
LVLLHEGLILAILILERGVVRQRLTSAPEEGISQEDLNRVTNRFNTILIGLEGRELAANILRPSSLEKMVLDHVGSMMEEMDTQGASELYQDGLLNVLRQPELAGMGKVEQTIRILEEGQVINTILAQGLGRAGVQVIIGGEGHWEEMSDFSLVMSRYGSVGKAVGVMGVLGPLRMPYGRAISAVRYVAGLMSDLVGTIYSD